MTRWIAITVAALAWIAAPAAAQTAECAEGRVRVEGRCCWPGQQWSDARGRCENVPRCPEGRVEHGEDCVPMATSGLGSPLGPPGLPPGPAPELPSVVPPGTTTAGWPLAIGSPTAPDARAVIGRGEDEGLIVFSLVLFDVGWVFGWLGLLLDELDGCTAGFGGRHISCESYWWGLAPLFGAMTGTLANHSGGSRTNFIGLPFGITSICIQGIGIIAAIIAFSNETTEPTFQRLDLSDSVTASILPGAAESEAGLTMALSF